MSLHGYDQAYPTEYVCEPVARRWIAIATDMRFHPLVGCGQPVKPANPSRGAWSRYEAWQDLICEASWKQRSVINKGKTVLLDRGQLMAARNWLATRWNWSEKTVRTWLDRLESESMVGIERGQQKGQQKHNLVNVVTIRNYSIYQTAREIKNLIEGQQLVQQGASEGPAKGQRGASEGPELLQGIPGYQDTNEREREEAGNSSCLDSHAEGSSKETVRLTKMNGTAIKGPGFVVPYQSIAESARSHGIDYGLALEVGSGIAEGWAQNGDTPNDPPAKMHAALGSHANAIRAREDVRAKPELELRPTESASPAKKRTRRKVTDTGTRLPADFVVPDEWRQWAKETHGLRDGQLLYLTTNFVRYWSGPDAKNPIKKDWKRTWQGNVDDRVGRGNIPSLPIPGSSGGQKVYGRPGR